MKILVVVDSFDPLKKIINALIPSLDITFASPYLTADEAEIRTSVKTYRIFRMTEKTVYDYDKILINASLRYFDIENMLIKAGIDKSTIININFIISKDLMRQPIIFQKATEQIQNFQLLILGNKTTLMDLDLTLFNLSALNLSSDNQDLYIDYMYLQKILSLPQNRIKYVLLNLQPYNLRYDLSKSPNAGEMLIYNQIFNSKHNFQYNDIFNEDFLKIDSTESQIQIDFNDPFDIRKNTKQFILLNELTGTKNVVNDIINDDDDVFHENVQILNNFITLCKQHNIIPIVFTTPVSFYFNQYFDEDTFNEFKIAIHRLQKKNFFYFMNYWEYKDFQKYTWNNTKDFSNCEYFNDQGAKSFTPYISNFIDKLENKKIRVAFIMQLTTSWVKNLLLIQKMSQNPRFELYGLITPSYPHLDSYGEEYKFFHDLYDNFDNMKLIDVLQNDEWIDIEKFYFDYVFYLQPYDANIHHPLKCNTVSKFAKTFHILYGIYGTENFIEFYKRYPDFYNVINLYFTDCQDLADNYSRSFKIDRSNGRQKFIFKGIPEIEDLCKQNEKSFYINLNKPVKNILWTPRWNYLDNIGGSHFLEYGINFLSLRDKYPDSKITFRPHPNLFPYMLFTKVLTEEAVNNYKNLLKQKNIFHDEKPTYLDAINESDVMITDVTSIMIDFFLTGKPMIYCPCKFDLYGDFKDFEKGLYIANSWNDVEKYLEMLMMGQDPLKDERRKSFEIIRQRHQNACDNIIQTLVDDYDSSKHF